MNSRSRPLRQYGWRTAEIIWVGNGEPEAYARDLAKAFEDAGLPVHIHTLGPFIPSAWGLLIVKTTNDASEKLKALLDEAGVQSEVTRSNDTLGAKDHPTFVIGRSRGYVSLRSKYAGCVSIRMRFRPSGSDAGRRQAKFLWDITYLCWNLTYHRAHARRRQGGAETWRPVRSPAEALSSPDRARPAAHRRRSARAGRRLASQRRTSNPLSRDAEDCSLFFGSSRSFWPRQWILSRAKPGSAVVRERPLVSDQVERQLMEQHPDLLQSTE